MGSLHFRKGCRWWFPSLQVGLRKGSSHLCNPMVPASQSQTWDTCGWLRNLAPPSTILKPVFKMMGWINHRLEKNNCFSDFAVNTGEYDLDRPGNSCFDLFWEILYVHPMKRSKSHALTLGHIHTYSTYFHHRTAVNLNGETVAACLCECHEHVNRLNSLLGKISWNIINMSRFLLCG